MQGLLPTSLHGTVHVLLTYTDLHLTLANSVPIPNSSITMSSALKVRIVAIFILFRDVRCATLPSTYFHRLLPYYDDIGLPDIL